MNEEISGELKLYMILLGSKAPKRNVEQHDFFFGIARNLKELVPSIRSFWPEAGNSIHLDGWREITMVDGYQVKVVLKEEAPLPSSPLLSPKKLFFINLGGYQPDILEEQHYTVLSVHEERTQAIQEAKKTVFFKNNKVKGAGSHIDEKYGIDVDDIYRIEDILADEFKDHYHLLITPSSGQEKDIINLGYLKLDKIK
ncbi:hypothetical protein AY601_1206 [Pedobacter cryoconitis]|uniref:DUF1543 domain-containing protein n=1 Tax=Pedobacter cryoconitis TaxID=188932 RepID=A0A127VAA0_9SPHI|nr:DUF1543 domain-containing protein [Pedobacter cryoconitis]AMP98130.1 hypothetical protein AY601_1206 [Pedobacter cryoconitis]